MSRITKTEIIKKINDYERKNHVGLIFCIAALCGEINILEK